MVSSFIKDYGVLFVFLSQCVTSGLGWYRRNSLASKGDITKLGTAIGGLRAEMEQTKVEFEHRCGLIESQAKGVPSKDDINRLRLEMERVRGDIRVFTERGIGTKATIEAQVTAVESQVTSARDLVERVERMVDTLTQHLLSRNI